MLYFACSRSNNAALKAQLQSIIGDSIDDTGFSSVGDRHALHTLLASRLTDAMETIATAAMANQKGKRGSGGAKRCNGADSQAGTVHKIAKASQHRGQAAQTR